MRRYHDALRESTYLEEHITYLREQTTSLQRRLDGMPHGSSSTDKMAGIVSGIIDEETAVLDKLARVHELRREVTQCIELVPMERVRRVLFLWYVQGLQAEAVGERIDRDKHSAYRIRNDGLAYIEEHCANLLAAAGYVRPEECPAA